MAMDQKNINLEDDSLKLGDDATATFDNSRSNPTEHASSENLGAQTSEDNIEEQDEDVEEDDDLDEDIEDDEDDEDVDEEGAEEEEDDDLITNSRAPSAYRML